MLLRILSVNCCSFSHLLSPSVICIDGSDYVSFILIHALNVHRECCCTVPRVQGKPCWPELWPTTLTAPSSGCRVLSWSRSSSERVSSSVSSEECHLINIHSWLIHLMACITLTLHQVPVWCVSSSSWLENTLPPSSSWTRSTPLARPAWRAARVVTARCRGRCWSCSISWMASRPPRTSRYHTNREMNPFVLFDHRNVLNVYLLRWEYSGKGALWFIGLYFLTFRACTVFQCFVNA